MLLFRNPPGVQYINETLKVNKEMQKNKKLGGRENSILRNKLDSLEKHKFEDNNEKVLFLEGATWMGERKTFNLARKNYNFFFF